MDESEIWGLFLPLTKRRRMELSLKRFIANNPDGVPGVLIKGVDILCMTLEEEWKDNARNISCIPEGSYVCKRVTRPSGQVTFEITGVIGRTSVLFHPGNTEEDTQGCVLVGMEFGKKIVQDEDSGERREKLAVLRSTEAFEKFMTLMGDRQTFILHVKWL